MIARKLMKLLQKFFKNDEKLNANEIAVCVDSENNKYKTLDAFLEKLNGKVVFTGEKTNVEDITFTEKITNAKFIDIEYGNANYGEGIKSERIYNPVSTKVRFETLWNNGTTNMLYSSYSTFEITENGMCLVNASGVAVGGNTAYGVAPKAIYINKVIAYF